MSKFGAHVSQGPRTGIGAALKQCADAGSPVAGIIALDQNMHDDIITYSTTTLLAFRTQQGGDPNPPSIWQGDPVAIANNWYDLRRPTWLANPADIYIPCNEMDAATLEQFDWQNDFELQMMKRADADGLKFGIGVHSTGTPSDFPVEVDLAIQAAKHESNVRYLSLWRQTWADYQKQFATTKAATAFDLPRYQKWARLVPSLQYAKSHGHILIVHEYGFDGTLQATTPDHALRFVGALNFLAQYNADPKVIIGECSDYNGYSGEGTQWLEGVEWYDRQVINDPRVLFFGGYQLGGAENWSQLIGRWADYVSVTPTPVPLPPAAREFDHWLDQDTGVSLGAENPLTFPITSNRRIMAVSRPKVTRYTCLVSSDSVDVTVTGGGEYNANQIVECLAVNHES